MAGAEPFGRAPLGSFDVESSINASASALLSGSGSLATSANLRAMGSARIAGSSSLSAFARIATTGSARFVGASALTATTSLRLPSGGLLAGVGALSVAAGLRLPAAARIAATGTVTSSASVQAAALCTLSGAVTVAAASTLRIAGAALFVGVSGAAVGTTLLLAGSSRLAGYGGLAASTIAFIQGAGLCSGVGTVTGDAPVRMQSTALLSGYSSLVGVAATLNVSGATLVGAGNLSASALTQLQATAKLSGELVVDAVDTSLLVSSSATFTGTGLSSGSASLRAMAYALFDGAGGFTSDLSLHFTSALLECAGSLGVDASTRAHATAVMEGTSALDVSAVCIIPVSTTLYGVGTFTGLLGKQLTVELPINPVITLSASSFVIKFGSSGFAGQSSLSAFVTAQQQCHAAFLGAGSLVAHAGHVPSVRQSFVGEVQILPPLTTVTTTASGAWALYGALGAAATVRHYVNFIASTQLSLGVGAVCVVNAQPSLFSLSVSIGATITALQFVDFTTAAQSSLYANGTVCRPIGDVDLNCNVQLSVGANVVHRVVTRINGVGGVAAVHAAQHMRGASLMPGVCGVSIAPYYSYAAVSLKLSGAGKVATRGSTLAYFAPIRFSPGASLRATGMIESIDINSLTVEAAIADTTFVGKEGTVVSFSGAQLSSSITFVGKANAKRTSR